MGLRMKLEDDPYSLTQDELMALQNNDRLNDKLERLLKDALIHFSSALPTMETAPHWKLNRTAKHIP